MLLASVELSRLLHIIFESLTALIPDEARHLKSSGSINKIYLKNNIFRLSKGCFLVSNEESNTYFALLSYVGLGLNPSNTLYLLEVTSKLSKVYG